MFQFSNLFNFSPLKEGTECWIMMIPCEGAWQVTVEVGNGLKVFATTKSRLLREQDARTLYRAILQHVSTMKSSFPTPSLGTESGGAIFIL